VFRHYAGVYGEWWSAGSARWGWWNWLEGRFASGGAAFRQMDGRWSRQRLQHNQHPLWRL